MTKIPKIAAAVLITLSLAACSGNDAPDADKVTETQMDEVDVIDGTISDDMVDVDTIKQADATGTEDESKSDDKKETASPGEKESPEKAAE